MTGGDGGQSGVFNTGTVAGTVDSTARAAAAAAQASADENQQIGYSLDTAQPSYSGQPTATANGRFLDMKAGIEAAANNSTIELPNSYGALESSQQIVVSGKTNVKIIANQTRLKMTGTIRPEAYIKLTGCTDCVVEGLSVDAGLDGTTSGSSTGYGIMVSGGSKNVTLRRCRVRDCHQSSESYAFCVDGAENVILEDCEGFNGGNGNFRIVDSSVVDAINCNSTFDIDRGQFTGGRYRHFNFETRSGGIAYAKSWRARGGRWYSKGPFESNWDVNPYGAGGAYCEYCEISPSHIIHDDYTANDNFQNGKFQYCKQAVMKGVVCTVPGLRRAVTSYNMPEGSTLSVQDSYFASGSVHISAPAITSRHGTVDIRNSRFMNVYQSAMLGQGYKVNWHTDSLTEFWECCNGTSNYFLLDQGDIHLLDTISTMDCKVFLHAQADYRVIFRYAGNMGQLRRGPNFKVYKPGVGNTGNVILAYSLTTPSGNRLCVSDLNGVGHLDHSKSWLDGASGTSGTTDQNYNDTSQNSHQIITTGGDLCPNTPGKLGDRWVNDNPGNGYPMGAVHDGSIWVEEFAPL